MAFIPLDQLDAIVFDFDGVLTDDAVYVDQEGRETVRCTRADGLGFDMLRKLPLKLFIITTERNPVVLRRGEKIKVPVFQGVSNKLESLRELAGREGFALAHTLYVGNDVNDIFAMQSCGYSACPCDAHERVREVAQFPLEKAGGHGVVREIVEVLLGLDPVAHWHRAPEDHVPKQP
jgi:3-deoxy-D-manno-octulosonate 8-phosphate phosphatase (KDO 8-P phosphatase)